MLKQNESDLVFNLVIWIQGVAIQTSRKGLQNSKSDYGSIASHQGDSPWGGMGKDTEKERGEGEEEKLEALKLDAVKLEQLKKLNQN